MEYMDIERFNNIIAPLLNFDKTYVKRINFPALSSIRILDANIPNTDGHFKMQGVCYNGLITAVRFRQDYILYYPRNNNELGISFEFTGCVMAQFCCNGIYYIAHIYLEQGHDTRKFWNNFIEKAVRDTNNEFKDFILFRPYSPFIKTYYEDRYAKMFPNIDISICGVIENSDCYSCIMDMKNCKIIYAVRTNDVQKNYGKLTMQNYRNVLIP